jgi:hypothetical protein
VLLFIYWLIILLLQFFPSCCPFALNFLFLLFSNLSIFLPLFSLFHVPYFHSVFVYFIFPVFFLLLAMFITFVSPLFISLSLCLPLYVEYCMLLFFFIFFNFKRDVRESPDAPRPLRTGPLCTVFSFPCHLQSRSTSSDVRVLYR